MIIFFILFLRVGTNEGIELIGRQQDGGHGHPSVACLKLWVLRFGKWTRVYSESSKGTEAPS